MTALEERFKNWDAENPQFYHLFCEYTLEAWRTGSRRLSAWLVVNRIRWEETLSTTGSVHKVPNDFIALFARKFLTDHPFTGEMFETRPMKRAA